MEASKVSNFSIDHILGTQVGPPFPAGAESSLNVACLPEERPQGLSNGFNGNLYDRPVPLTAASTVPVPFMPHDLNSSYLGYGSYNHPSYLGCGYPRYHHDFNYYPNLPCTSFNNERGLGSLHYPGQAASQRQRARMRTVFTDSQTKNLEQLFGVTDYPDLTARAELARSTGLTEETVRVWFKNRRARRKRQRSGSKVKDVEDGPSSHVLQTRAPR